MTGNYYAGLLDFEDKGCVLHLLRRGAVFADVGANMRSYSVLAGEACQALVFAYEPTGETNRQLSQIVDIDLLGKNRGPTLRRRRTERFSPNDEYAGRHESSRP